MLNSGASSDRSARKELRGIVVENLALGLMAYPQRVELLDVSLDCRHARPGPIRSPKHLVGNLFDSREVFKEFLRRDAGDIHMQVLVAANKKKSLFHPQRSSAVRKDTEEIRVVDRHVIAKHRLGMKISGPRKDGCSRMNHDRQAVCLGALIDGSQATIAGHIF